LLRDLRSLDIASDGVAGHKTPEITRPAAADTVIRIVESPKAGIMTDQRKLERLIAQLREQVAELRRLEREGAPQEEVSGRRRLIALLQEHLAYAVRDLLNPLRPSST
jgi:hypothetical protein